MNIHIITSQMNSGNSHRRVAKRTPGVLLGIAALCLSLGGHPAQALVACEQGDGCDGGGGTTTGGSTPAGDSDRKPDIFWTPPSAASAPACRQNVMPPRRYVDGFAAPADYDGDGKTDPSVVTHNGTWAIDYSRIAGFGGFDEVIKYDNALKWTSRVKGKQPIPLPGDYDGDCSADRSAKDAAGNWYIDYAANGFGKWDVILTGFGDTRYHPVPADYDGDGKVDLSTKDTSGNWFIDYAANGYGEWDAIYHGFGGPEYRPVPADYDGDGKADFSTRDGDNWFVDWSSNGRGEEAWDAIYPGFGNPDVFMPIPADYDGDGKADFSSRDTWDNWYIDWSSNGRGEVAWDVIHSGFAGTDFVAVPADYDGDSRADLASMRYNGQWLIDYAANSFGNWDQIWDWLPRAPNKVGITTITDDAMTITWQDNSSTESGFIVEMKTDYNIVERIYNWIIGASSQWIPHRVGSDLTELTITGLYPDHKSCFRVYAETAYGNSETSTVVCGKTQSSVTKPTPQPYPRGVKTYYLFNCHYQFRTVHAWVRDLTTAGNWVDHRELPAAPSGACRQNGTAYATFNPISGHRYHVVAIDGSLGNCPEDNPDRINGSCRRFETVFDGDTSGYTRYDAIDSNTITSPLTGYEPPPPPVNNPPPRQPGGGDGRPPRQEQ